jgi:nitroimidazol reductase NimA-like FMN-containing flavoprotein (pyridoxamine 5'-phosphate oxidase superfamily)
MRKTEQEIKNREEIESIIQQAQVCRVAFTDDNLPYIVPMNFGYKDNCLYFHCAVEGKKLDILRRNNQVCFEMDVDVQIVKSAERVCNWGAKYRSVIGFGKAFVVENWQEKAAALNTITGHYGADHYGFTEKELNRVCIIKIAISSMTGKKAGY